MEKLVLRLGINQSDLLSEAEIAQGFELSVGNNSDTLVLKEPTGQRISVSVFPLIVEEVNKIVRIRKAVLKG